MLAAPAGGPVLTRGPSAPAVLVADGAAESATALVLSPATPPAGLGGDLAASLNASIPASAARRLQKRAAARSAAGGGSRRGGVMAAAAGLLLSPTSAAAGTPLVARTGAAPLAGVAALPGICAQQRYSTEYDDYDNDAEDPQDDDDSEDEQPTRGVRSGRSSLRVGARGSGPNRRAGAAAASRVPPMRAAASAGELGAARGEAASATDARSVQLLMLSPPRRTQV